MVPPAMVSPKVAPSYSPPSLKRRRCSGSMLLTPPLSNNDSDGEQMLGRAVNVLSTAATALSQATILYQSDHVAREGLLRAVDSIAKSHDAGGKLIICGVGKSGLVGKKLVATMKSLGVPCSFLHPSEALHGDLGDLRADDAILFISYSGSTSELLAVLDHVPQTTPVLAITKHKQPADCLLLHGRPNGILLPAPIHEPEELSFGVCAPTTSTTVAIAVGDMLALTLAEAIHQDNTKHVFQKNHPGGAIGARERARRKSVNVDLKDAAILKRRKTVTEPS